MHDRKMESRVECQELTQEISECLGPEEIQWNRLLVKVMKSRNSLIMCCLALSEIKFSKFRYTVVLENLSMRVCATRALKVPCSHSGSKLLSPAEDSLVSGILVIHTLTMFGLVERREANKLHLASLISEYLCTQHNRHTHAPTHSTK